MIKEKTGFKIIRINRDKENFDIDNEIGKIQVFISDSNKKLPEESTKKLTEESTKNKMTDDTNNCVFRVYC